MTTRIRRTPEQMIADTQAKLETLQRKAAISAASEHPALATLVSALTGAEDAYKDAQKGLGSGPQSFASRLAAKQAWIGEIEADQALAVAVQANSQEMRESLTTAIQDFSARLADNEDITEYVESFEIPELSGNDELVQAYNDAHAHRMSVTNSKRTATA